MKKTLITVIAALALCVPSFAGETGVTDSEVKAKKEKKSVTYNEKGTSDLFR